MNFAQNQRVCQDRSSIHITEEKQIISFKKKCVLELLLSTMQLFWTENEDMREKKDRIF